LFFAPKNSVKKNNYKSSKNEETKQKNIHEKSRATILDCNTTCKLAY